MIYFNNAADSFPKLQCVNDFLSNQEYFLSGRECSCQTDTKKQVTEVFRSKIKDILNLPDDFQVTITHGATEAANLAIQSFYKFSDENNYVIIDHGCHNSVIRPCYELFGSKRCIIHNNKHRDPSYFDGTGLWKTCFINKHLNDCKMIIFSYQCNVTGSVLKNADELIDFVDIHHMDNTAVIFDITQAIGNTQINVSELLKEHQWRNVYLFGTTHKSLGSISGTGFLVHPKDNNLVPLIYGGTGIGDHYQPREFPHYLESGTYNITSLACANKAIDYSMSFLDVEQSAKARLVNYFIKKYNEVANNYMKETLLLQEHFLNPSSGIINFFPKNQSIGEYITTSLFHKGFVTRFGCHCCSKYEYVDNNTSYKMSIRISFNAFNTIDEIDKFFEALSDIIIELVKNDR